MRNFLFTFGILFSIAGFAQMPGMRPGGNGQNMNIGHLYGKIVNSKTGKGIDGASLQLVGNRYDSATHKMKQGTLRAMITAPNGDFEMNDLPVMGSFTLHVSAIGFKPVEQKVAFFTRMPGQGAATEGGREQMMNMVDKDLGNIKLEEDAANLGTVTVTATTRLFEMGVDRKIFNVDKNLVSSGQTATEVMKSIPSLSVDIDGNVTLRNAAPQLFVDGRPTTLTMDQIPADIIDKVELITNPSAKFDASGGNAGILNIVLKKNKKTGYNGGVRAGVDTRGKINVGGDINLRQNKLNFFLSGMVNQRASKNWTTNDRTILNAPVRIYQDGTGKNDGAFAFVRGGFDYFIDNRNTISATGSYSRGKFTSESEQLIDSIINGAKKSLNVVEQNSDMTFKNVGTQLSYKHNFAKPGHEWTADANYYASTNDNNNLISTSTYYLNTKRPVLQQSIGGGNTYASVIQTDYTNPLTDNKKIELGARVATRDFENLNTQSFFNFAKNIYEVAPSITANYAYTDRVYAAYSTYSFKVKKWSYQLGLRAESSNYDGTLLLKTKSGADSSQAFNVAFPISLFPSAFVTYKLSDKEDVQINYSRRINRPNFFQLMPFIDFSDPQNISVGNANLKPEFTNSFEVSYNNSYKKGANFLSSIYFKQNTNLITRYQYLGVNPDTAEFYSSSDSLPYNTYVNANNGFTFGLELTNRIPVTTWWDNTMNFNLFNSKINIKDQGAGAITNQRTSWFVKMNNNFKLAKTLSVQFSGDYYARTVLPQEGGRGGRGGGGGMFGGGNIGTAQGYINPRYSFDLAIRKDFAWKGGNTASLTLSINDVFRTQLNSTYTESPIYIQTTERRRDPQVARLNFNYRFGKFDINLLKRKNTKADQGTDMMIMQ